MFTRVTTAHKVLSEKHVACPSARWIYVNNEFKLVQYVDWKIEVDTWNNKVSEGQRSGINTIKFHT